MALLNKPKQVVETYGLYNDTDEGVKWLIQQGVTKNAIGLSDKACPFRIKTHLKMCTHKFNLDVNLQDDMKFREYEFLLPNSDLLKAFDPVLSLASKKAIYFQVTDVKQFNIIVKAQQVLNPSITLSLSAQLAKEQSSLIFKRLDCSNLGSYVVYGLEPEHLKLVDSLARAALVSKGKLILCGKPMPLYNTKDLIDVKTIDPNTTRFFSNINEAKLREIGSYRLKKFMRS